MTATPLNPPFEPALVRPISVLWKLRTISSPGANPSPLILICVPPGPLVRDKKIRAGEKGRGGTVGVGALGTGKGATVDSCVSEQTPTALHNGGPHTDELANPISATAIGTKDARPDPALLWGTLRSLTLDLK